MTTEEKTEAKAKSNGQVTDDVEPKVFGDVRHLEGDFWKRPSLKLIYDAALARMCSPWAVLAYCAARMLYLVPPSVGLPPLVGGGRGSLNWFAIVCDKSSGGKTAAASIAEELVLPILPVEIETRNVGSGEGITGAYVVPPAGKGQPPTLREAVMFTCDEIDSLTAMNQRQGSTTLSTLRTAFTAGTLGFSYITKGHDTHLVRHTYRMTLVVNAQPSRTGGLLADHGGGTPQRFMWFPANDPRIAKANSDLGEIMPLTLPTGLATMGPAILTVPPEAMDLILSTREKAGRGEQAALDGHALFCRLKFAYALALIDGRRDEMSSEDWRLSGIAAAVSDYVRGQVIDEVDRFKREDAADAGAIRGVMQEATDNSKQVMRDERVCAVLRWVLVKLAAAGGSMTRRELQQKTDKQQRPAFDAALALGRNLGQITLLDDGVTWEKVPE